MNRKDMIRMARETGLEWLMHNRFYEDHLQHFAALVAAASASVEREKVAAWMIQRGYATGHGDTTEDLLGELNWQVLANWSSAMKTGAENEREACAKLCDRYTDSCSDHEAGTAMNLQDAIRARGQI